MSALDPRSLRHANSEPPTRWRDEAVCTGYYAETWFPMPKDDYQVRTAKGLCRMCPVQSECLIEGMETDETLGYRHGIWGGMTPDERKALAQEDWS